MAAISDRRASAATALAISVLCVFVVVGLGLVYWLGDLSQVQEAVSARQARLALDGVNDPQQLDQVLKQYPSNEILRMIVFANKEAMEIDAATRRLLDEAEPRDLSTPIDFSTASRTDLDALGQDLKTAEANTAALEPRYSALIKAGQDKLKNEARSMKLGNAAMSRFMAMIDEQHREMLTLASKVLAARTEYYGAYQKCVGILLREFGIYKVTDGQFIFPFPSTANSYNNAAAALAAAAKRVAELEDERKTLRQSQFDKWKDFAASR